MAWIAQRNGSVGVGELMRRTPIPPFSFLSHQPVGKRGKGITFSLNRLHVFPPPPTVTDCRDTCLRTREVSDVVNERGRFASGGRTGHVASRAPPEGPLPIAPHMPGTCSAHAEDITTHGRLAAS
jgi:hypothetical protein